MSEADNAWDALVKAEEQGDLESCNEGREDFIDDFPKDERSILARFHLGMHFLYRERDSKQAQKWFKEAAQFRNNEIAQEARISYAILLKSQKKDSQAIFELRKMLPSGVKASVHTVNALDFLCEFLKEDAAAHVDLAKMQDLRLQHLQSLIDTAPQSEDKAYYLLRKGVSYLDIGTSGSKEKARKTLAMVLKMKESAGHNSLEQAREYLKNI